MARKHFADFCNYFSFHFLSFIIQTIKKLGNLELEAKNQYIAFVLENDTPYVVCAHVVNFVLYVSTYLIHCLKSRYIFSNLDRISLKKEFDLNPIGLCFN